MTTGPANGAAESGTIDVTPLPRDSEVRIKVTGDVEPGEGPATAEACALWDEMRRKNPRVYDGTLLCARLPDIERATQLIRSGARELILPATPTRFSRWATSDGNDSPVMLSVTALVVRPTEHGVRILVGRRGPRVHHYPGLWEIGPSGGVPPPGKTPHEFTIADFRSSALEEAREEVGEGLSRVMSQSECVAAALLLDPGCRSLDVVLRFSLLRGGGSAGTLTPANWEYDGLAWEPPATLLAGKLGLSAPTWALLRQITLSEP